MKTTCITCTGDRPEAFELCCQWMKNQTIQPDQWIIIDDGKSESILNYPQKIGKHFPVWRMPTPDDPVHTLNLNIKTALQYVTGDIIIFFEDDDYYSQFYIETISKMFIGNTKMVGFAPARYYHLPTGRYCYHDNRKHASLAQTAIHKDLLYNVKILLDHPWLLDVVLWGYIKDKKMLFEDRHNLFTGIKGMPGRKGINTGHTGTEEYYKDHDTPDRQILKAWIPKDYMKYKEYAK